MPGLYDMHNHLDFAMGYKSIAKEAQSDGMHCIDATILPSSYVSAKAELENMGNMHVSLGMHPWWVAERRVGEVDIARFENLCRDERLIGEIGLDFSNNLKEHKDFQIEVLMRILDALESSGSDRLVSVHSVHASDKLMDIFEDKGTFERNQVIMHWFSGTDLEFGRAVSKGCYFTVGLRMLASEKGRKFASAMPIEKLLLETDNPPHDGMDWSYGEWKDELDATLKGLAEIRSEGREELAQIIEETSRGLLEV